MTTRAEKENQEPKPSKKTGEEVQRGTEKTPKPSSSTKLKLTKWRVGIIEFSIEELQDQEKEIQ